MTWIWNTDEPTHWKQTILVLPKRESRGENADPEIEEEVVEVDDVIGWEICSSKARPESRQCVIEAAVLDPAEDDIRSLAVAWQLIVLSFKHSQTSVVCRSSVYLNY